MQSHLQEILVQLGEVNHAIDDIIGYLNQMEDDLNQFDKIYGDPGHVILHLRKIQVVPVLFRVMCDPDRDQDVLMCAILMHACTYQGEG